MTDKEKIEQASLEFRQNSSDTEFPLLTQLINSVHREVRDGFKAGIQWRDQNPSPKVLAVLDYCEPHLDKMWAAAIVGILLNCDFRNAKEHLKAWKDKR